jgi:hypothetical protein
VKTALALHIPPAPPRSRPGTGGQLHNRYLKANCGLQWLLDNPPDDDDPYSPQAVSSWWSYFSFCLCCFLFVFICRGGLRLALLLHDLASSALQGLSSFPLDWAELGPWHVMVAVKEFVV